MSHNVIIEIPAEAVETIRQWASDTYAWQERLRHEYGGRNTADALRLYNEAWAKGSMALRVMSALQPAREALSPNKEG